MSHPPAARPSPNAGATGPAPASCRVEQRALRGGRSEGLDLIEVDNGRLKVAVLPQRGMGVWKAWLGEIEFGWRSPVRGPVHPAYVPLSDPGGLGWLEGFDELLCRCGLASNGAPDFDAQGRLTYPLHGRIANLPADAVAIESDPATGAVSVAGVVHESRMHFDHLRLRSVLTLRPGQASFDVRDEVTNLSARPASVQLLYHYNLGPPVLDAGATVVAPVRLLVPRNAHAAADVGQWPVCAAPSPSYVEQVYFADLHADGDGRTLALLRNAAGDLGASVRFDRRQLPCFVLWKNTVGTSDGYVTGIEPGTNFPNPRSFEAARGRTVALAPGSTVSFDLRFTFHQGRAEVAAAEAEIEQIQGGRPATVAEVPQPDWCI